MSIFIRFKNIPHDEISHVYDGDNGIIGTEPGVCVFDCIEKNGVYKIILPSYTDGPVQDLQHFLWNNDYPIYLVTGNEVGTGTYGEPCLKNIKILHQLKAVEFHQPEPKFKLDRTNVQLVIKNK